MPSEGELLLRLLLAVVLGGVIGLERELTGQAAGLRTHMTVALGSALFGVVSAYSFTEFIGPRNDTTYQVDVTRIASNIVTGVGFLGGGAIIKSGASVRGLTTAASLWVTAAVGLGIALGSYLLAIGATAFLILALSGLRAPARWLRRFAAAKQKVIIHLAPSAHAGTVIAALEGLAGIDVRSLTMQAGSGHGTVVHADVSGANVEARLAELAERDDVADVDIGA